MSNVPRARALALIEELSGNGAGAPDPRARLVDLGVDSLVFAELAAALEAELGVDLSRAEVGPDDRVDDVVRAVVDGRSCSAAVGAPIGGRLQRPAKVLGGWAIRWWFRLRVTGAARVPATGPAVLAMNHDSALDIPVAVVACPRPITFMAKKELFRTALVSWALGGLGGFPVDRDRFDLPAVNAALAAVARGDVLGMYPEGTRSPGRLLPFLHGAAWIALRTGAPLVPCSLSGTDRASRATRPGRVAVGVAFHEPIAVERVEDARERRRRADDLTARLRSTIEGGRAGAGS